MKLGFLGAGAMGGAILNGALSSGLLKPDDIYVYDVSDEVKVKYNEEGCHVCKQSYELRFADVIIVAVKPQYAKDALSSMGDAFDGKAVISIMAGVKSSDVRNLISSNIRLLRIMPNTPALVNHGAFAFEEGTDFSNEEIRFAENLFGGMGICEWIPENLIDAVTGLSGAGPAYAYIFIEALADGGVLEGLPRNIAIKLAAQTVMGAAQMVLQTGEHPDVLKDKVCSPGGNTIVGVKTLEEHGFRGACIDTVVNAVERAKELSKR